MSNQQVHILHIANDFAGSTVYKQLITALGDTNINQTVYTAIRDESLVGKNYPFNSTYKIDVCFSAILNTYTRVNFYEKRRRVYSDLIAKIPINDVDIVHAHTWYSDGCIALRLYEVYQIPYLVTIRNTDINLFQPYMLHLRGLGEKILKNARRIVFISEAHKRRLLAKYKNKHVGDLLQEKSIVIPNGVDNYWLENMYSNKKPNFTSTFKLVYVGNFNQGKNVPRLMKAIIELNKGVQDQFFLTLVGGGGQDTSKITKIIRKYPNYFSYLGRKNKEELCAIYRSHDAFVMPSLSETFGLVYVEAMSQGLPVLYSKGEGIDGFFSSCYGVKCAPTSLSSIISGIQLIKSAYSEFHINKSYLEENFSWENISGKYLKIYGAEIRLNDRRDSRKGS